MLVLEVECVAGSYKLRTCVSGVCAEEVGAAVLCALVATGADMRRMIALAAEAMVTSAEPATGPYGLN